MNYYAWANGLKRPKPKTTEHGTEIVDIPGILVTEESPEPPRHGWRCKCRDCRLGYGEEWG